MPLPLQSRLELIGDGAGNFLYSFADTEYKNLRGLITDPPEIIQELPETLTGVQPKQTIRVRINPLSVQDGWKKSVLGKHPGRNRTDPTLAEITMGWDIRGKSARYSLFDLDANTTVLSLDGVIAEYDLADGEITIENLDFAALAEEVPRVRLIDLFPTLDTGQNSGDDPRVIVPFGLMRQVPLTLVHTNNVDVWDYGAIRIPPAGVNLSIATAYRDKAQIPPVEYQLVKNRGVYVLRFFYQQIDNSGNFKQITVDILSDEFANQADAALFLFSDPTYGLGLSCNTTSFSTSSSRLQSIPYVVSHGIGPDPVKAETVVRDLAIRGTTYGLNANGLVFWDVDDPSLHPTATHTTDYTSEPTVLGYGDGVWNNITSLGSIPVPRLENDVKAYELQGGYTFGFGTESYLLLARATKDRATPGTVHKEVNKFIGDEVTLRREAGYRLARLRAERHQVTCEIENEMREITKGAQVVVRIPSRGINSPYIPPLPFICSRLEGSRRDWSLKLVGYDEGQFSANAQIYLTSPGALTITDHRWTLPPTPTNFSVVTGTLEAGDKTLFANVTLQCDAPTENFEFLVFEAYLIDSDIPVAQIVKRVGLNQLAVKVQMRFPVGTGTEHTYFLQVFARNTQNQPDFQDGLSATISPYVPGTDTTPPATPVLTNLLAINQRLVTLQWNKVPGTNEYQILRETKPNLVENASFETPGFDGWTPTGTPQGGEFLDQTISAAHSGVYGGRIGSTGTQLGVRQDVTVTNGLTYTIGVWYQVVGYSAGSFKVFLDPGSGVFSTLLTVAADTSGPHVFFSSTFTAVGSTARLWLRVETGAILTARVDDVVFVEGTPAPVFLGEVQALKYNDTANFVFGDTVWYQTIAVDRSENPSVSPSNLLGVPVIRIPIEDLPQDAPLPLSNFSVINSAIYYSSELTPLAYFRVSWTNPFDTKRAWININYRRTGNEISYRLGHQAAAGDTSARIDDLLLGLPYDLQLIPYSANGVPGPAITLLAQVTAGDTSTPAKVTGLTITNQPPRGFVLRWNDMKGGNPGFRHYRVDDAADSGFTVDLKTRFVEANEFVLGGLIPPNTRWARVRQENWTAGVVGAYSNSVSATAPRTEANDVGDETIGTTKLVGTVVFDPGVVGADAILVKNSGKIRIQVVATTPGRVVFENSSSVEKMEISGLIGDELRIQPIVSGNASLALATFLDIAIAASGGISLNAGGNLVLNGDLLIDSIEPLDTGAAASERIPVRQFGASPQRYIRLFTA